MNLNDALAQTAAYLGLNADDLIHFAAETPTWADMPYGYMSIDRQEGMFLYAIVRALKPARALEIGSYAGVSAQHILAAGARLTSMDKADGGLVGAPDWTIRIADATTATLPAAEFVFEDSDHQLEGATAILMSVKALHPRVVVSHDYYSHEVYADPVGFQVKEAFDGVFGAETVLGVRWDDSPRGFGIWRNPDWQAAQAVAQKPTPRKRPAVQSTAKAKKATKR